MPAPDPAAATASAPPTAFEKPVTREAGYKYPPVDLPTSVKPAPAFFGISIEPPPAFVPGLPFGAPTPPDIAPMNEPPATEPPFGVPFAVLEQEAAPGTWAWEPPEDSEEP